MELMYVTIGILLTATAYLVYTVSYVVDILERIYGSMLSVTDQDIDNDEEL